MRNVHKIILASSAAMLAAIATGFGTAQTSSITVYAGRSEPLVEPLVQAFQKDTGIKVNVRYGTDAALYATLSEEGAQSPADIFWANTSGALVNASKRGFFNKLPASTLKRALEFVPKSGTWTPLSLRTRMLPSRTCIVNVELKMRGSPISPPREISTAMRFATWKWRR